MTNHQAHLGDARFLRLEIDRTVAVAVVLEALAMRCDDLETRRACTRVAGGQMRQVRRLQTLFLRKAGHGHRVPGMCPYVPTCLGTLWLICVEMQTGAARLDAYAEVARCAQVQRLCRTLAIGRAKAARELEAFL